jgi:hypothetical protein
LSYFLEPFHELLRELAGYFAELPPKQRRAALKAELEKMELFSPEQIDSVLDEMEKQGTLTPTPKED